MTKSGLASRSPTALYSEARGRLTDTLEERGVPPRGHESSAPLGDRRPSLINTLGGASAVLATLSVLDQSTSINRSRACLDATRRLAAWLASWGEWWLGGGGTRSIHIYPNPYIYAWARPQTGGNGPPTWMMGSCGSCASRLDTRTKISQTTASSPPLSPIGARAPRRLTLVSQV